MGAQLTDLLTKTSVLTDAVAYRGAVDCFFDRTCNLYSHFMQYGESELSFLYPPGAIIFLLPLKMVPLGQVGNASLVLNLLASIITAILLAQITFWQKLQPAAWLRKLGVVVALLVAILASHSFRDGIGLGQINILLLVLILLEFHPQKPKWLPDGLLIGVAAGIKVVPGFFIVVYLFARHWRAIWGAAAGWGITLVLGAIRSPALVWDYYTHVLFQGTSRFDHGPEAIGNWAWSHLVVQYHLSPAINLLGLVIILAVGLAGIFCQVKRGNIWLAVCVAGLTQLAVNGLSWRHHWVWFTVAVVVTLFIRWWVGAVVMALPAYILPLFDGVQVGGIMLVNYGYPVLITVCFSLACCWYDRKVLARPIDTVVGSSSR